MKYYTVREVSRILKLTTRRVRQLIENGTIDAVKKKIYYTTNFCGSSKKFGKRRVGKYIWQISDKNIENIQHSPKLFFKSRVS